MISTDFLARILVDKALLENEKRVRERSVQEGQCDNLSVVVIKLG